MDFEDKIAEIRLRFCARAQDEAAALDQAWLDRASHSAGRLEIVEARAHALAGTASLLRLEEVAGAAKRVEQCVRFECDDLEVHDSVVALCNALRAIAPLG